MNHLTDDQLGRLFDYYAAFDDYRICFLRDRIGKLIHIRNLRQQLATWDAVITGYGGR